MRPVLLLVLMTWSAICLAQPTGPSLKKLGNAGSKTWAVVVGISDYQDADIPDLRFADKDALAFAGFLQSPAGGSLDEDHLKVLTNEQATQGQFGAALDWLWEVARENDRAIIYFSGHGDVERKSITQPGYLLCWDAPVNVYMGGGAFNVRDLNDVVSTLSMQNKAKVILITDACRAGKLSGSAIGGAQATAANLAKQYANEIKILSCQPDEYSIEGEQWGGGRGAFSYHLLDGLYGMADSNNDETVSLKEISRYLEDRVSEEVAPQKQNPMTIGGVTEKLTDVFPEILAALKEGKRGQMQLFAATESRGIEDDVLAAADTNIVKMYFAFQKALKDKQFLEPATASADYYYEKLSQEPQLEKLHSSMRRNYAAALQDDAQQAINIWLKADVQQMNCIGKTLKLEPIPALLGRAAEILGPEHYMYDFIKSRQYLFEGTSSRTHNNPDEELGRKCINLFKQSIELEPQSPLPWYRMSEVYVYNMRMPDSAFYCVEQAMKLAPEWVLPYTYLSNALLGIDMLERAEEAYSKAAAIQENHPYVIGQYGHQQIIKKDYEAAVEAFQKYDEAGGPKYPCWHNDYGIALSNLGRFAEAEEQYLLAFQLDSTNSSVLNSLAKLYLDTRRMDKAEETFLQILALDSMVHVAWFNLGYLYHYAKRDLIKAEEAFVKASEIDPTRYFGWIELGHVYKDWGKPREAIQAYQQAYLLDTLNIYAFHAIGTLYTTIGEFDRSEDWLKRGIEKDTAKVVLWNQLGYNYLSAKQYDKAEAIFQKIVYLDPNSLSVWNNLGNIYKNTGRTKAAEEAYQKAFELDKNFLPTYGNYAGLKMATGEYTVAIKTCEDCLEIDSTNTVCLYGMAYSLLLEKQYGASQKAYNKLLTISPKELRYQADLAFLQIRTNRFQEADMILSELLMNDSNAVRAIQLKGYLNLRQNNLEEALAWYQKALSIDYNNASSLLGMAYVDVAKGSEETAIEWVEKAIQSGAQYHTIVKNEDLELLSKNEVFTAMLKTAFPDQQGD